MITMDDKNDKDNIDHDDSDDHYNNDDNDYDYNEINKEIMIRRSVTHGSWTFIGSGGQEYFQIS